MSIGRIKHYELGDIAGNVVVIATPHCAGTEVKRKGILYKVRCLKCGHESWQFKGHVHIAGKRCCGCRSKLKRRWYAMMQRCYNPACPNFRNYGERGISVCERWRTSMENFIADTGEPPTMKHSIDRINNDGNYEPGNVRWATSKEQIANRRKRVN